LDSDNPLRRSPQPFMPKSYANILKRIKLLGFWGVLFFVVKGFLWLLVPALMATLANSCAGS